MSSESFITYLVTIIFHLDSDFISLRGRNPQGEYWCPFACISQSGWVVCSFMIKFRRIHFVLLFKLKSLNVDVLSSVTLRRVNVSTVTHTFDVAVAWFWRFICPQSNTKFVQQSDCILAGHIWYSGYDVSLFGLFFWKWCFLFWMICYCIHSVSIVRFQRMCVK